jgi:peptidoglycan/xylan/chitin deacetylase (PgdA/CDA1 family)
MLRRTFALLISLGFAAVDSARSVLRPVADKPSGRGVVLYYHAVKLAERGAFAWQMDELVKRAHPFRADSPETMVAGQLNVAVTFDDGFESVLQNAVPELTKRQIPFTMFVPSGSLGERPCWVLDPKHRAWNERVLSAADLRVLAKLPLAQLGSHSVTHPNLLCLGADDARRELVQSRADLEANAGSQVDVFSFPHGAHNPALLREAQQAGYKHVFTVEPTLVECGSTTFTIGRVGVDPHDWPIEFRLKIVGAYRWRAHLHRWRMTSLNAGI